MKPPLKNHPGILCGFLLLMPSMLTTKSLPKASEFAAAESTGKAAQWIEELSNFPIAKTSIAIGFALSDLLRFAKLVSKLGYKKRDIALFECGARQDRAYDPTDGSQGKIAYLFASKQHPDFRYYAFEPGLDVAGIQHPSNGSRKRMSKFSIQTRADLCDEVDKQLGKKRLPILFSCNQLDGGNLVKSVDFTHIAGLQFHCASAIQLMRFAGCREQDLPRPMQLTQNHIDRIPGLVQSKYRLDDLPIVSVSATGMCRIWWCNSETTDGTLVTDPPRREPVLRIDVGPASSRSSVPEQYRNWGI